MTIMVVIVICVVLPFKIEFCGAYDFTVLNYDVTKSPTSWNVITAELELVSLLFYYHFNN